MAEIRNGNAGGAIRGNQKKNSLFHSVVSPDPILINDTQQEKGANSPSFVSHSLEKMDKSLDLAYQELVIKSTAGTMYAGGCNHIMAYVN
jgi:hypothetical protein